MSNEYQDLDVVFVLALTSIKYEDLDASQVFAVVLVSLVVVLQLADWRTVDQELAP